MKMAHRSHVIYETAKAKATAAFGIFHGKEKSARQEDGAAPPTKKEMLREIKEYQEKNPDSLATAAMRTMDSENRFRRMQSLRAPLQKAMKFALFSVPVAVLIAAYSPRHAGLFPKPVSESARLVRNFALDAKEILTNKPDHAALRLKRSMEFARALAPIEEEYARANELRSKDLLFTYSSMTLGDLMDAAKRMEPAHEPDLSFLAKVRDSSLGVSEFIASADSGGREGMLNALRALDAHREWVVDYRAVMNRL